MTEATRLSTTFNAFALGLQIIGGRQRHIAEYNTGCEEQRRLVNFRGHHSGSSSTLSRRNNIPARF